MDLLWNSASLRLSCAVAFSRCAWATLRFAWAWVRLLRGMRGSILARSVPLLTSSPVWTGISRISPEAFDFTLSVRIGWIAPEAVAVTTMSRRATGTSEYGGAVSTLWQAAARAITAAVGTRSDRVTAGPLSLWSRAGTATLTVAGPYDLHLCPY